MLQKVAALIWYENRVLLWPCSDKKAHAPLWGFIGGAVVSGETRQETLSQELFPRQSISNCW
ncbi:MAG: hypothetical protein RRZ93_00660 [Ruthenibacterium sp.]